MTLPPVFTIGYEGLVQTQLLDRLVAAGVRVLLDVRAVPLSRKAGFSKRILAASAEAAGLRYVHERGLGTPKPGREAARKGRAAEMQAIFNAHMRTQEALTGLARAVELARAGPVCLLCFEREPHLCHRSIVAERIMDVTHQAVEHLMA